MITCRIRPVLVGVGMLVLISGPASADEPTVAEELLDILRAQGQISEAQYQDLSAKAQAEKEALRRAQEETESLRQAQAESEAARQPAVSSAAEGWKAYWKDGTRIESPDGDFKIKLGGRIMNDWAYIDADDEIVSFFEEPDLDGGNGTELRRARLFVSGTLYEKVFFKAQYDFAGGDADFKDVYVGLKGLGPLGSVKVGHFKEPFSLEELTSSKYITFMERSLPNAFSPSRNTGIAFASTAFDQRMTWGAGVFRDADDFGEGFSRGEEYNVTGRVTGLPWYAEEGARLLHVGLSYSHRFRDDATERFRQRPEMHLSPARFVDTSSLATDGVDLLNPELAMVLGPFSLQSEYTHAMVNNAGLTGDDPTFHGLYVEGSFFLTGEHRRYDTEKGAFGRVKPRRSFDGKGGPGAWQVAVRYSTIDLDDEGIEGGELDDFGVGVNWYVNPSVRVMLNYIRSELERQAALDDVDDAADILQARFQIDF